MNKIIIGVGVLAVIIAGWFLFGSSTVEYAATVEDEVSQLENELASIEAEVKAGTLSPEDAAKAQVKIVARIDSITGAVSSGQKATLTDAQRVQLINGLDRLKVILTKYRATLVAVDEAVLTLPEVKRPKLNRGSRNNNLADIAIETIETVEEQVEEIIDDITDEEIVADLEIEAEIEADIIDEDTTLSDDISEEGIDSLDTSTTSDDFIFVDTDIEAEVEVEAINN